MKTPYNINDALEAYLSQWMDDNGELHPDAPPFPEVDVTQTALSIKDRKDFLERIAKEEQRLKALKATATREIEYLKSKIEFAVPVGEKYVDKLNGVSVYWQKTKSVVIAENLDLETLPEDCVKIEKSVKKTEIKKHLANGGDLNGCVLKENENLVVRLK